MNVLLASVPLFSHASNPLLIGRELARRGHSVTYLCFNDTMKTWASDSGVEVVMLKEMQAPFDVLRRALGRMSHISSPILSEAHGWNIVTETYGEMRALLKPFVYNSTADVTLIDGFFTPIVDLLVEHQRKVVLAFYALHNFRKRGLRYPAFCSSVSYPMTWVDYVRNLVDLAFEQATYQRALRKLNKLRSSHGLSMSYREQVIRLPKIVSAPPEFEVGLPDNTEVVGAMVNPVPVLPQKLQAWLDEKKSHPVVYVGFGTTELSKKALRIIADGVAQTGYPILWWMDEATKRLFDTIQWHPPAHVLISTDVPQRAVLSHPSVQVFFSHCGRTGLMESLYFGKPIVGMSIVGDQCYSLARMIDAGVAVGVYLDSLTPKSIASAIHQCASDPKIRIATKSMQEKVSSLGGVKKAADMVERIAKI